MAIKQGYPRLNFSAFPNRQIPLYIEAVQKAAELNYTYMERIIEKCFEDETEPSEK